jgi:hypothetical protein
VLDADADDAEALRDLLEDAAAGVSGQPRSAPVSLGRPPIESALDTDRRQ